VKNRDIYNRFIPSDQTAKELDDEIESAKYDGSADLIASENLLINPQLPNRLDKQNEYGTFYDDIDPDIRKLEGTAAHSFLFNGKSFDRQRNNSNFVLFDKQVYDTPTLNWISPGIINYNARGAHIIINLLDINIATDALTVTIEGLEPGTGKWYNILVTPALTSASLYILKIYPGLNPIAGFVSNDILPRNWRAVVAYNAGTTINWGVSGSMIL